MQHTNISTNKNSFNEPSLDDKIREKFVDSLMNYFKIAEDEFLRAHINDLIKKIKLDDYEEFFRRLSDGTHEFKNAFERISLVATSMLKKEEQKLFTDVDRRVKKLYDVCYELYMKFSNHDDAQGKFTNISFMSMKLGEYGEKIFDHLDEIVIRKITKEWLYKNVNFDKSLFITRAETEYKNTILELNQEKEQSKISNNTNAVLKS